MQELADQRAADRAAHVSHVLTEFAQALASKAAAIADRPGSLARPPAKIIEQTRIRLVLRLTIATRSADPLRIRRLTRAQFRQSTSDRAARDALARESEQEKFDHGDSLVRGRPLRDRDLSAQRTG
jgi:hypothetical protein